MTLSEAFSNLLSLTKKNFINLLLLGLILIAISIPIIILTIIIAISIFAAPLAALGLLLPFFILAFITAFFFQFFTYNWIKRVSSAWSNFTLKKGRIIKSLLLILLLFLPIGIISSIVEAIPAIGPFLGFIITFIATVYATLFFVCVYPYVFNIGEYSLSDAFTNTKQFYKKQKSLFFLTVIFLAITNITSLLTSTSPNLSVNILVLVVAIVMWFLVTELSFISADSVLADLDSDLAENIELAA